MSTADTMYSDKTSITLLWCSPFMVKALILYCCEVVVGYRGEINMTSLNSALYILRRYKVQCILCFFHSNSVNLVKIRCLLHLFFSFFFFVLEG